MLNAYLTATENLLQNPAAATPLYDPAALTVYINTARNQIAGEGECIRFLGTVNTTVGNRVYNFSSINTGVSATNGILGPLNVRSVLYAVGSGQKWMRPRPWEWFQFYAQNNPVPPTGPPARWSVYGQGATGSFYIDPLPNFVYVMTCDCVCLPIPLVNDSTVEAIPPLWQDAVSYFAAYLALLSAQSGARSADANRMMERFEFFMQRARQFSNPSVTRHIYDQAKDPTRGNKLGIQGRQAASGGGG
jgi:hypothetical protein